MASEGGRLGAVWGHHFLKISQEGFVDGEQAIDVAKHGLGLVRRNYGRILVLRVSSQRVGIVVLENLEPLNICALSGYELVDD